MAKERFVEWRPQAAARKIVEQANAILEEYCDQGFTLTVRQLFYQFVARDHVANSQKEYKRLYRIIGDARDAGLIDWDAIEDRTREVNTHAAWDSPADIVEGAAASFQTDRWLNQPYRPEVWIEKDALLGVIEGVCTQYRVPYYAHRGNDSKTSEYRAGKRFAKFCDQGLIPVVLHLADHDPNGIDMTRDIRARLALYAREEIEVRRLALTREQVRRYRPPPNFAKEDDSRFGAYVREFGRECWELDALAPSVIANLIRDELEALIEPRPWRKALVQEALDRQLLTKVAENWALVEKFLREEA